jgi:hypothetical protein
VIAREVGGPYFALRDEVEAFTVKLANDTSDEDFVDLDLMTSAQNANGDAPLFKSPGVYLRVTKPSAISPQKIRESAKDSLRDAFSACFLRTPHLDTRQGKACKKSKDCERGEICNELDVCSKPMQPYNLRIAYRGLFVLDPEWVRDVETASEELRLRWREDELTQANANDIPIAVDLVKRAKYFLVVVDDVPKGLEPMDGGTIEQAVQSEVHQARVGVLDLERHRTVLRVKRTVDVDIPVVPGQIEAQRRQVLNCALAQEVRASISH